MLDYRNENQMEFYCLKECVSEQPNELKEVPAQLDIHTEFFHMARIWSYYQDTSIPEEKSICHGAFSPPGAPWKLAPFYTNKLIKIN